jgi:hypothetical protein
VEKHGQEAIRELPKEASGKGGVMDFEKRARQAVHKDEVECPHCHDNYECNVCERTVQAIAQALREAVEQERREIIEYLADYRCAYSEDIFLPRDLEQIDPNTRTTVAGHMGRFVLDNCLRDVRARSVGEKGE